MSESVMRAVRLGRPRTSRPGRMDSQRLVVRVSVLVAILAVVAGLAWWKDHSHDQVEESSRAALAAATTSTVAVLSYTAGSVNEDLAKAENLLTGKFREDFSKLAKTLVGPAATRDKISTHAEVVASSVMTAEADRVVTLLFVNQATQSESLAEPRLQGSRLKVTMQKVGNRWLISELKPE